MLSIQLNHLSKKFNKEWIFKDLSYTINANDKVVLLGGNGSGKSTLLQVISGFITENEGEVIYKIPETFLGIIFKSKLEGIAAKKLLSGK